MMLEGEISQIHEVDFIYLENRFQRISDIEETLA